MGLIGTLHRSTPLNSKEVMAAIQHTFGKRAKSTLVEHEPPRKLPRPPVSWRPRFLGMVEEFNLPWKDLDEAYTAVEAFLNPVLAGVDGVWHSDEWEWM